MYKSVEEVKLSRYPSDHYLSPYSQMGRAVLIQLLSAWAELCRANASISSPCFFFIIGASEWLVGS